MGRLICVCDEATEDLCRLCKKGRGLNPDQVFNWPLWVKDTETTPSVERQLIGLSEE